jgi:phosphoenolpyruvate carboxylase
VTEELEQGHHFPEKDQPLRADVNRLGALLGEVLQEQCGQSLFERVERARTAAKMRRDGDVAAEDDLIQAVTNLEPGLSQELVRAFSTYFGLVNLAERVHRIRRRRIYRRDSDGFQAGGLKAVMRDMARDGVTADEVIAFLDELDLAPVFTAHPTEATRRTLLRKERRIADHLLDRVASADAIQVPDLDVQSIREEVTAAWQTATHDDERPTVADEVEHVIFYISDVIYHAIPDYFEVLEQAVAAAWGDEAAERIRHRGLNFGSWVGGDMDGNPNVGPDTIRETLARHRMLVVERYRRDVHDLFSKLSQSLSRVQVSDDVLSRIHGYRKAMPTVWKEIRARYHDMPYRVLLYFVGTRLRHLLEDGDQGYGNTEEFIDDLEAIAQSLRDNGGTSAGHRQVQRLLARVRIFGFHLASLDIRQDAAVHREAIGKLMGVENFSELSAKERLVHLERELSRKPSGSGPKILEHPDPLVNRTLDTFVAVAECRKLYGARAIGATIVSMAQGPDDALAVLALARRAGLGTDSVSTGLDVVPLFETVPDLENAGQTLATLLAHPLYRAHLAKQGDRQQVMLGYSDSGKRAGLAASRWALQEAQRALLQRSDNAGVRLVLFHGRGGTISRGGSKPRNAILAEPPGSVRGQLRVTEQGEIIHAKFGFEELALRSLELMTGATLQATLRPPDGDDAAHREIFAEFSRSSRSAFRALVYEHKLFLHYFSNATPIDAIRMLAIGSRPASRKKGNRVEDLRAIPWVFAWTQSRHILTGWYGVGRGLEAMVAQNGLNQIRMLARNSRFFFNLLSDVEMVLAKADMPIAARYAQLAGDEGAPLFEEIRAEFERTAHWICEIGETSELLENDKVLQRAIRLRNPYVDPMSLIQVDLLKRWRDKDRDDEPLLRALLNTVHGIARGLQNTG